MTPQNRKKFRNFMFCAGCPLLRAEGFSCSLDVLYGGIGIRQLQFLIKLKKLSNFCFSSKFFSIFGHKTPGSGLDPDRYSA
jgi:hypothetical protein